MSDAADGGDRKKNSTRGTGNNMRCEGGSGCQRCRQSTEDGSGLGDQNAAPEVSPIGTGRLVNFYQEDRRRETKSGRGNQKPSSL